MSPDSLLSPGDASPIRVHHAGSLNTAMADLARDVQAAYRLTVATHGGPSVGLANGIRGGKLRPTSSQAPTPRSSNPC